jgi:hypothetical protein
MEVSLLICHLEVKMPICHQSGLMWILVYFAPMTSFQGFVYLLLKIDDDD